MPERAIKDSHEPFLKEPASTRHAHNAASTVGFPRDTDYRHGREDDAFAAQGKEALAW